jgi:hypothetical protein
MVMLQAIILVGGFGKCEYVYDVLKSEYQNWDIGIICPRGEMSDA